MYKPTRKKKKANYLRHLIFLEKWRYGKSENMGYVDLNKWKIRGWKRRVKFLDKWGHSIVTPYSTLEESDTQYVRERFTFYPWYRFSKHRQPPLWFFKKIINHFVLAFDTWDKTFRDCKEPFDLFLEIHDPHFILSEIECEKMERHGDQYAYWPSSEEDRPFPYEKFQSSGCNLKGFEWKLCCEEDFIFESEFEDYSTNEQSLVAKGYDKRENQHGVYFFKRIGDVWMARKNNNST